MSIRLVALDIDGTLLDPGVPASARPSASMTRAVRALLEAGVHVVLASGRMYPGTARIARHLGITSPLICQQGASIHEADGALRHGHAIDGDIALELLAFAQERDHTLAWFDATRYLVTRPNRAAQHFADVSDIPLEIHREPHRSGIRATGIDIISSIEESPAVHEALSDRYGDRLSFLDFPSVTAVHAPAASKGNALALLADELGVPRSDVLAIGDSVNDVSMLEWAAHSAAPGHCDAYARAAAGEILEGTGVSGVARLLESLLR